MGGWDDGWARRGSLVADIELNCILWPYSFSRFHDYQLSVNIRREIPSPTQ